MLDPRITANDILTLAVNTTRECQTKIAGRAQYLKNGLPSVEYTRAHLVSKGYTPANATVVAEVIAILVPQLIDDARK